MGGRDECFKVSILFMEPCKRTKLTGTMLKHDEACYDDKVNEANAIVHSGKQAQMKCLMLLGSQGHWPLLDPVLLFLNSSFTS